MLRRCGMVQRNFDDIIWFESRSKKEVTDTSKQCYKELKDEDVLASRHREYLDALWSRGVPSTDSEVAFSTGHLDPNYFRPRRYELENKLGLVVECNPRACSVSGRVAKTFWFTVEGLKLVGDLK
jgi:hypothetical protein